MSSAAEQEVFWSLGELTAEQLEHVCSHLKLETEGKRGNKLRLTKLIFKFLTSDELENSEDGGASYFAAVMEIIQVFRLEKAEANKKLEGEDNDDETDVKPPLFAKSPVDDEEKFKEIFMKAFKINGKIGKPSVKDSLTYSSLIFQIDSGIKKGYSERHIIDAVVKAISSSEAALREYLEGKVDLTLKTLCENLRFFYQEKDATSLFTILSTAKQNQDESPQDFIMRLINLRQKVLFVAKQENSNYDVDLVQKRFLHAIATGLKNDNIRGELKPFLKGVDITDEKLLARLQLAMQDETERQEKFAAATKKTQVNAVLEKSSDDEQKKKFVLSAEIDAIKAQLNEVTEFVRHNIHSSSQQNGKGKSQRGSNGRTGRGKQPSRCESCEKDKVDVCEHCFYCGSEEHMQAGCKVRFNDRKKSKN